MHWFRMVGALCVALSLHAQSREDRWRQDIEFVSGTVLQTHPQPFAKLTPEEFDRAFLGLSVQLSRLTDAQIVIEINRILARLGDPSTLVPGIPGVRLFPIRLRWFSGGWYVTEANQNNLRLLGKRVTRINGSDMDEVMAKVGAVIPHQNEQWVRANAAAYLVSPEILQATGVLASSTDAVSYELEDGEGGTVVQSLRVEGGALFSFPRKARPNPPLFRRSAFFYWFEYLEADETIYIQYNTCQQDPSLPMREFAREIVALAETQPVRRMVIDLRNNTGGSTAVTGELFQALLEAQVSGKLKLEESYAIISRLTFSSGLYAALDLRSTGQTKLVGEIAGDQLTSFGEARGFALPNSRLLLQVSTRKVELGEGDLVPDMPVDFTIDDWASERDPWLEAILKR